MPNFYPDSKHCIELWNEIPFVSKFIWDGSQNSWKLAQDFSHTPLNIVVLPNFEWKKIYTTQGQSRNRLMSSKQYVDRTNLLQISLNTKGGVDDSMLGHPT